MGYQIDIITNKQLDEIAIKNSLPANSLGILMPYSYVSKLVSLNWYDLLFAIENGFLSHQSAIKHAILELENNKFYPQMVLDLACLTVDEAVYSHSIHPYIDELAKLESEDRKKAAKNKIMYALLQWVYDHREDYEDSLKVVEFIYDDFGFPESITSFVRYMPSRQPIQSTLDANIERLYSNWYDFLEAQKVLFRKTS